jgi:hypothetical protein
MLGGFSEILLNASRKKLDVLTVEKLDFTFHVYYVGELFWLGKSLSVFFEALEIVKVAVRQEDLR